MIGTLRDSFHIDSILQMIYYILTLENNVCSFPDNMLNVKHNFQWQCSELLKVVLLNCAEILDLNIYEWICVIEEANVTCKQPLWSGVNSLAGILPDEGWHYFGVRSLNSWILGLQTNACFCAYVSFCRQSDIPWSVVEVRKNYIC